MNPFIANTDRRWFDFLAEKAENYVVDEVNFWSPKATRPMRKDLYPGEPVFLRLKYPAKAIAGYGFFAHFRLVQINDAWEIFGWKNGATDPRSFFTRIGEYRGVDLFDPRAERKPMACTILRDVTFWPKERWIPWSESQGWSGNIIQGKREMDSDRAERLIFEIRADAHSMPNEFDDSFVPLDIDDREFTMIRTAKREGQGTFRLRLLDAYECRCAITGEHTEPVLDAAHIQPYLGPKSNHPQNGLLLTKEFHRLFDLGYVAVTPEYEVRVSPRLRKDWQNGRRYYPYDGQPLVQLPESTNLKPSQEALEWHLKKLFKENAA